MSQELKTELDKVILEVNKTVTFGGFMRQVSASVILALTMNNNPSEMVDRLSEARAENIQKITTEDSLEN